MNKLMEKVRKNKKAFTLVELVVVIVVIAILAAVLIPQLSAMINKSKTAGVNEKFHEYQTAVMSVAVASENSDYIQKATAEGKELTNKINAYLDTANKITATKDVATDKTGATDPWGAKYAVDYYKISDEDFNKDGSVKVAALIDANKATTADDLINAVTITSLGPDGAADGGDDLSTVISWKDGSYHVQTSGLAYDAK